MTGAGHRLGRAIALGLAGRGAKVAVHYHRSEAAALTTCRDIVDAGGHAIALPADLRDRPAARRLIDQTLERWGGLDMLVASAGDFARAELDTLDDDEWDRMLELDLTAPFVLAQRAIAPLRAARGSIVFVTCASTASPFRHHLPYVVAKGGLSHLMRALALELAPTVRVNAVAPGTVLPPPCTGDADLARLAALLPLGRLGEPEDVVRAVLFLAESPFVTGQELYVDGGRSIARVTPFTAGIGRTDGS